MKKTIIFALCLLAFATFGIQGQKTPVKNVSVSPDTASVSVGGTFQLTDTVSPANVTVDSITSSSLSEIPAATITAESQRFRDFEQRAKLNQQKIDLRMDRYKYMGDRLYQGNYFYKCSHWESYDMIKNWGKE